MSTKPRKRANILLGVGAGMTALLLLLLWLSETAMPVVVNVAQVGVVTAFLALVFTGGGLRRALTKPDRYRGKRLGLVLLVAAVVLGGWFFYDGSLSFRQEEVRFDNGDVMLAGTLYLPNGGCPCPAAVFVHGSGAQARDEYRYYARTFAQHGIIGLVYDKRGTGASMGNLYSDGYEAYADDAAAGVQLLRQRSEVAEDGVGLVGFSEGEWVVPLAANSIGEGIEFIVVVGPSGLSPAEQVNVEIDLRLRSRGYSDDVVQKALALNDRVLHFQRTGQERDSLLAAIRQVRDEPWFAAAEDIPWDSEELGTYDDYVWWRSVMDTNPASIWSRVDAPVLCIKGGRDAHSSADVAELRLREVLERRGNADMDFVHYPEADHMILEWPLGEGVPPPVFAKDYLEVMMDWIRSRTDRSAA